MPLDRGTDRKIVRSINLSGASGNSSKRLQAGINRVQSTGSGAGWALQLPRPTPGTDVTIIATLRSTADLRVFAHSTAATIAGTTSNVLAFSTGGAGRERTVRLLGVSPSAWSLVTASTGVTLAASTSPF